MLSIIGFLLILAPLVVVHEFGHFFFARLFGVRAEIFSVGFGPVVFKKQWGETEFRVSAIPLGGFVKLFGEEPGSELPEAEKKVALQYQEAWKRFFIYFGGPMFNFIYAIFVFMAILAIGEPRISSIIGRVIQFSDAEVSGLRFGDNVLAVNGEPVKFYIDFEHEIRKYPNQEVTLKVKRENETLDVNVKTSAEDGYSMYAENIKVGTLEGVLPYSRTTEVGPAEDGSIAAQNGIDFRDQVFSINGEEVGTWEKLEEEYNKLQPSASVRFVFRKYKSENEKEFSFSKPTQSKGLSYDVGIFPSELYVSEVVKDSPVDKAGLKSGDRIIEIAGQKIFSFMDLRDAVQKGGEKDGKVLVVWRRDGQRLEKVITPDVTGRRDPNLKKVNEYTIGIKRSENAWAQPYYSIERIFNPFVLFYRGVEKTAEISWHHVVLLGKMFSGKVSLATLGGPISIGKIAGVSLSSGWYTFLNMMGVLSVVLAILNVLPIPVLDGGHILLLGVEVIRGKPLSVRQMEVVQQIGLSLIILLMVIAIRNDITRLSFFN